MLFICLVYPFNEIDSTCFEDNLKSRNSLSCQNRSVSVNFSAHKVNLLTPMTSMYGL